MIHRIYSNDSAFKELTFYEGFNVLIAEKGNTATALQSRNGAGKSSFLRVVHFLLGGSCKKGECAFLNPALVGVTFGMEFDLAGDRIAVERSAATPGRVYFRKGPKRAWPVSLERRKNEPLESLTNENWKVVLGTFIFRLQAISDEERAEKFVPTFRTMIGYFARLNEHGALAEPTVVFRQQQLWSQQVALASLLGLDWRIPQSMQLIRAREKTIKALKAVIDESEDPHPLFPSSDELEAKLTLAVDRALRVKRNLDKFQVHPEYRSLEVEANDLTSAMASGLDEDTWDRESIATVEAALRVEAPPEPADLQRLYREAQVDLPGIVLKRFEDVRAFHESIVRNRRSYLESELSGAQARLAVRAVERQQHDARRRTVMSILTATGALEQFIHLQTELGRLEGQAESLRQQTTAARQIENLKRQIEIETAELELRLSRNHDEHRDRIQQAQLSFAEISQSMYETPGNLVVNSKLSGPPVRAVIHGQMSVGIQRMQIFSFDMTLARITVAQDMGPGFVIHDSHLFDGVDPRQVMHAMMAGKQQSEDYGFQYIVTMNSDQVEAVREAGFDLAPFALAVRLNDQATGGLFGRRFS